MNKKLYLLTLEMSGIMQPIGKILLADNNIDLVVKGINKIEANGRDDTYYQTYASNIKVDGDASNTYYGSYKDGVRWANMNWSIEEIETIA